MGSSPGAGHMRLAACSAIVVWLLAGTACAAPLGAADPEAAGARPQPAPALSTAACAEARTTGCPAFLADWYRNATSACADAGGMLHPASGTYVWSLDVDADETPDYFLFDSAASVVCEGAPSLFSCGSLGCSKTLYRHLPPGHDCRQSRPRDRSHTDAIWQALGGIHVDRVETLTLLASGALRVDCSDGPECTEQRFYVPRQGHYQVDHLQVRDHRVEVADSPHGLRVLTRATALLAAPVQRAMVLANYPPNTVVAVIGTAGDYRYVSPCNACRSGFMATAALSPADGARP